MWSGGVDDDYKPEPASKSEDVAVTIFMLVKVAAFIAAMIYFL